MNIAYTMLTNGYDASYLHTQQQLNWRYLYMNLFTQDQKRIVDARRSKILYHETLTGFKYDVSLWHDSNIQIIGDLNEFIDSLDWDYDFHIMKHDERDCVYDEAVDCIFRKKDNADVINEHVGRYRAEGYPEHHGMVASGIIVRRDTEANRRFCEEWFTELCLGSIRDQLSFNHTAWKTAFPFKMFDFIPEKYFIKHSHNHKK